MGKHTLQGKFVIMKFSIGFLVILLSTSFTSVLSDSYSDVLVFVKSVKEEAALEELLNVKGTTYILKVKQMDMGQPMEGWDIAVVGRGMTDPAQRKQYISKIESLKSIGKILAIPLQPAFEKVSKLNTIIGHEQWIGHKKGTLLKRPLKPHTPALFKCDPIHVPEDYLLLVITLMKYKNYSLKQKWEEILVHKLFPSLNVRYAYIGTPKSDQWDEAQAKTWMNTNDWCEMVKSEYIANVFKIHRSAMDQLTFTAFPVKV